MTDNGVQIINITDPYNPTNASSITDVNKISDIKRRKFYHHCHNRRIYLRTSHSIH